MDSCQLHTFYDTCRHSISDLASPYNHSFLNPLVLSQYFEEDYGHHFGVQYLMEGMSLGYCQYERVFALLFYW